MAPTLPDKSNNQNFQEATQAYKEERWSDAEKLLTPLINQPQWQFAALYNLGNAAMRQGLGPKALAYYRKAQNINPHDKDTAFNISLVSQKLGGPVLTQTQGRENLSQLLLEQVTFGNCLFLLLISTSLFLYLTWKGLRKKQEEDEAMTYTIPLIASGIISVFIVALTGLKLADSYSKKGTIVSNVAELRSGPGENNPSITKQPGGLEVKIENTVDDWVQVVMPDGISGWIPQKDLMITSGGGPW